MNLWTVVLKAIASTNGSGEWPYQVRADSEQEAVEKAIKVHQDKNPRRTRPPRVSYVVEWYALY